MNMESALIFEKMILGLPPAPDMVTPTEELIFEDSFANEIYMKYVDESPDIDLFSEMEQKDPVNFDELQSFANKIDLPINDFVASIENPEDFDIIEGGKGEQLLFDFNSIFENIVESELTPPQSPPPAAFPQQQQQQYHLANNNIPEVNGQYELFNSYQPTSQQQQALTPPAEQFIYIQNASPVDTVAASPGNDISILYENSNQSMISASDEIIFDPDSIISSPTDIQRELEVVDELVRAHSRQNSDFDDSASSSWSPRSEYSSSGYSQFDEEPKKRSSGLKGVTKKRSRGYGRNPEEKKSRKKEQNKNAATRYRQKKKQEVEIILDEEKILMDKNKRLTTVYKDTKREVKYLKSLLRDLFKARGFI